MLAVILGGVEPCGAGHCSDPKVYAHVNAICKENGWPAGRHVVVDSPTGGKCYCTCSCLAKDSPVEATPQNFVPIQDFAKNSPVMAGSLDFQWKQLTVESVVFTDQIGSQNVVFVVYDGGALTVTADHLFLVSGSKLLTANKLTIDDTLTAKDGSPVKIIELHQGDFFGAFFNLTTSSTADPSIDPRDHLINTGAIISGDYALQTRYVAGDLSTSLLHPEIEIRPEIGSIAYHNNFPFSEPSEAAIMAARTIGIELGTKATAAAGVFVSRMETEDLAEAALLDRVLGFVPLHLPGVLEELPRYKFSDANRKAMGDHLCKLFSGFYPAIAFEVAWYVRNVNVYSIRAEGAGPNRVIITGGALRNKMLDFSSVGLAIAYAVANINAAEPVDAGNVGYADYYGAAAVMRNVWWELQYFDQVEQATVELKEFFSFIPLNFGIPGNPPYPSGLCRIETYECAAQASGIPACAELSIN